MLKSHLRKKRHYKLNPDNRDYDQFYLVNHQVGVAWQKLKVVAMIALVIVLAIALVIACVCSCDCLCLLL